jgi:hypothetical protein
MTALLESLLALARADANVGDDHVVACFARPGSSGALDSLARQQGLTLRFANSHEPAWILGDITALRRRMAILMDSGLRNKAAFLLIQSSHGTVTVSTLCSRFGEGIGRLLTVDTIHRTRNRVWVRQRRRAGRKCSQSMSALRQVVKASGDVVQLVRMLPCHGRGRGFEPRRPRHTF